MNEAATRVRYQEFVRRTGRTESSDSVREFLHLELLRAISVDHSCDLILHGGCKMRYIDGSPRYSMDMDFSHRGVLGHSEEEGLTLAHQAVDPPLRRLADIGIKLNPSRERWHRDKSGLKLCFKVNKLKEFFPRLFADHPGDINFNIDIDALLPGERVKVSSPIADRSLQILILDDPTHMARKVTAVLLRNQVCDLYDLDMYITRGIAYDLPIVRLRLGEPKLSHGDLVERLCQRVEGLDLKARAHQLHLPTESERDAFLVTADRIAVICRMCPF